MLSAPGDQAIHRQPSGDVDIAVLTEDSEGAPPTSEDLVGADSVEA
jgi:hypothetical protein